MNRYEAYKKHSTEFEDAASARSTDDPGPLDDAKETIKQKLAEALVNRVPSLTLVDLDHAALAADKGVDLDEAKRLHRTIELHDEKYSTKVSLFDDSARVAYGFTGSAAASKKAFRFVWDCLEALEADGGFSTYDTQIGKILDLAADFDVVFAACCVKKKVARAKPAKPKVSAMKPPTVVADMSRDVRPYGASEKFEVGDRIEHPSFGEGLVEVSEPGKATIWFTTGRRVLGQARVVTTPEHDASLAKPKPFDHSNAAGGKRVGS